MKYRLKTSSPAVFEADIPCRIIRRFAWLAGALGTTHAFSLLLRSHVWEQQNIANRCCIRQQHHQSVNTDPFTSRWRQAILQSADIVSIIVHGFIVPSFLFRHLSEKTFGLVLRIVEL